MIHSPTTEQLRIHIFLRDPVYRKWFARPPVLLPGSNHGHPWWVYVQREEDGPWQRAGASSYDRAYNWVKPRLRSLYDFSITSKRRAYSPPVYRPVRQDGRRSKRLVYWTEWPANHRWCPYCRRPTVFRHFTRHHADSELRRRYLGPSEDRRCSVCGIREAAVEPWTRLS